MREASWVAQSVTGGSAYIHGVDYDHDKFLKELNRIVDHVKKQRSAQVGRSV